MDCRGNKLITLAKKSEHMKKKHAFDDVHFDNLPEEKQSILRKLLYLFTFYSGKASKHSYDEIQECYFMELIENVWAISGRTLSKNSALWVDLKILYYSKGSKNSLNFKNFLELLPTLAVYAEPEINREEALRSLMHNMAYLYQSRILNEIDKILINVDLRIEENTKEFLFKLSQDLLKIYKIYFPHEISAKCKKDEFKQLSFECLLEFLKDFEIYPKFISARDVFYIFTESLDSVPSDLLYETRESRIVITDEGRIFKLTKFLESLIIMSKCVIPKLKQMDNEEEWQYEQKNTVRSLLEYMETVKRTFKKISKFQHERFCLIVLSEYPEKSNIVSLQVEGRVRKEYADDLKFFRMFEKIQF